MAATDGEISVGLDASEVEKGGKKAVASAKKTAKDMKAAGQEASQAFDAVGNSVTQLSQKITAADRLALESSKQKTAQVKADAKVLEKAAQLELETERKKGQLGVERQRGINVGKRKEARTTELTVSGRETRANIFARGAVSAQQERDRRETNLSIAEERRKTDAEREEIKKRLALHNEELRERRNINRQIDAITRRGLGASPEVQARISGAIKGDAAALQHAALVSGGMTNTQAFHQMLTGAGLAPESASHLLGRGKQTLELGGKDVEGERARKEAEREAKDALNREAKARDLITRNQVAMSRANMKLERVNQQEMEKERKRAAAALRDLAKAYKVEEAEIEKDVKQVQAVIRRVMQGGPDVVEQVKSILYDPKATAARMQAVKGGQSYAEVLQSQLLSTFGQQGATFAAGGGGRRPTIFGGNPPGGGGGGGVGGILRRLLGGGGGGIAGSLIGGVASGLGIGLGGYALTNLAGAAISAAKTATAYERQLVAAKNLAGGQEELNKLLEAYNEASGGAVSKTDALAGVTRLLSTGYAKSASELARVVRASRGAGIALGRPQEEVIQDVQLAISNTSQKRLDQIGLGIEEVTKRIKEMRKQNVGWSRETAFGEAVLSLLDEKYGSLSKTMEGQATGLEKLAKAWDDLTLAQAKNAKGPINTFAETAASGVNWMQKYLEDRQSIGHRTDQYVLEALMGKNDPQSLEMMRNILKNNLQYYIPPASGENSSDVIAPLEPDENVLNIKRDAYKQSEQIEKEYNKARLAEITQYEESRASMIRNYQKSLAREEEDFQRSRARSLRDYEKSVVDIMRDAQERDADIVKDRDKRISELESDLNENIEEMRSDSNKRMAEAEEEYQEQREDAIKNHNDRLLKAASRLDAAAIYEEQKQWAEEQKQSKKQREKQVKQEQEALEERIDDARKAEAKQVEQAREAAEERLEDARKADAKRLADMAAARAQQQADEDEDRAIQKGRAAQDHADELEELDRQHGLRLAQIEQEAEDNRKALEDALAADLAAVGVYIEGYQEKWEARDKVVIDWVNDFVDKLEEKLANENADRERSTYDPKSTIKPRLSYGAGGPVRTSGPAILHAGEFVLSRDMLAAGYSPVHSTAWNSSNSKEINIHEGAIQVHVAYGMEEMVGNILERQLTEILEAA
jgi:hypothetical protein